MTAERNPMWQPISPPAPKVEPLVEAYRTAQPVRIHRSQRYGLVLVEPLPEPVWRQA